VKAFTSEVVFELVTGVAELLEYDPDSERWQSDGLSLRWCCAAIGAASVSACLVHRFNETDHMHEDSIFRP
jgi:hypothetical protein